MKKFLPFVFSLALPLSGALADEFTNKAVAFCKSNGGNYSLGSMEEKGSNYCRQVKCAKTNAADGSLVIKDGAKGPEANVEAVTTICVPKSEIDGKFDENKGKKGASGSGSKTGSGSSSTSKTTSGSGSGSSSSSSSSGGSGNGAIYCAELEGEGTIRPGGLCYEECKSTRTGFLGLGGRKEGFEREECVRCLLKYPDVFKVKKEYLPTNGKGKIIGDDSVSLGKGVSIKTGTIVCKDANGNIVQAVGSACPTGTVVFTGGAAGGSIGAGGSGTIIVAGGAGAGGGGRFGCSAGSSEAGCMGDDYYAMRSRYEKDCVNCGVGVRQQSTLQGVAEIVGAIAPPLAMFGSAYVGAKAYENTNLAWAGAYRDSNTAYANAAIKGFENCRLHQQDYTAYLSANELPGLTPEQQARMNCNGYQLNGYGGLGGNTGGWNGSGYSPGFLGGMMGPYGGYNPYGGMNGAIGGFPGGGGFVNGISLAGGVAGGMPIGMYGGMYGGVAGGMPIGIAGGMYGGVAGGMPIGMYGGMAGGLVNGISLAGGVAGGMPIGIAGGMYGGVAGGMPIGIAGGMYGGVAGGMPIGIAGGMYSGVAGGMPIGMYGGMASGLVNGISLAGGVGSGMYGGMYGGMNVGMPGGFPGGAWGSGVGGWPGAGGMNGGGYWGASGGWGGNPQADYMGSMQASSYDRMLQQQGSAYQMGGNSYGGYGGGAYAAGFSPMNAGFSLNGSIGGW